MFKHKLLIFYLLPTIYYLLFFIGCATIPLVTPHKPEGIPGIYHRIEKGETLWRISKIYNVNLDEIIKINRITDVANIEVNQLIFIPQRQKPLHLNANYRDEDFIWPLKGKVVAVFGQVFDNSVNKGINIQPHRTQDVIASRSGRVVFYKPDFGNFGKTIIIDHGDGFLTVYARNQEVFIKTGDSVQKGNLIARVRSADKDTYLHFEIRKGHIPQNPYFYLSR